MIYPIKNLLTAWQNSRLDTMKIRLVALIFVTAITGLLGVVSLAAAGDARDYIAKIAADSERLLQVKEGGNSKADIEGRNKEFARIFSENIASEYVGNFVLGPTARQINDDQRKSFYKLFSDYSVKIYVSRLDDFAGAKLAVNKSDVNGKDTIVSTLVTVKGAGGQKEQLYHVDWRVREFDGNWRVTDLVVEGVSMTQTMRDEFQSIINRNGFQGLVDLLKQKLGS